MIRKYSQLKFAAATKEQILAVANKLNLTPEEVIKLSSEVDSTRKYEVWLLKQMGVKNIRLPEDAERVTKVLKNFELMNQRRQLKFTNLNQYKTIHELEEEIRQIRGDIPEDVYDYNVQEFLKLPGVTIYGQSSEWFILQVLDPVSLTKLGDSTEWCTRHIQNAEVYMRQDGAQFVVFKKEAGKLKKYAQFAKDFNQFKDVKDEEIMNLPDSLFELVTSKLPSNMNLVKRNETFLNLYLKQNTYYKGDLNLSGVQVLKQLPAGFHVAGNLNLSECHNLKTLPAGFHVAGSLNLSECHNLEALPPDLVVEHSLDITDCIRLKDIPNTMQIGYGIRMSGLKLNSLPDMGALNIVGDLDLSNSPISSLPRDLHVEGGLRLRNCPDLVRLPERMIVEGDIDLGGCVNLTELPEDINTGARGDYTIQGDLILVGCKSLTKIPDSWNRIAGAFNIFGCTNLKKLPYRLSVGVDSGGICVLSSSGIEALPEGFTCTDLEMLNTPVREFPVRAWINGRAKIEFCQRLRSIPENSSIFENCDNISLHGCSSLRNLPTKVGTDRDKGLHLLDLTDTAITKLPERLKFDVNSNKGYLKINTLVDVNKIEGKNPRTGKYYHDEYLEMNKELFDLISKSRKSSSLKKLNVT